MIRVAIALGLGLVRSQLRHDRWRPALLFVGAAIVAAATALLAGADRVRDQAAVRDALRRPVPAEVESDVEVLVRGWTEPLEPGIVEIVAASPPDSETRSVVELPGLSSGLLPGEIALSPALAKAAGESDTLGARFARWKGLIIDEGALRDRGELLAYVRPSEGEGSVLDPRGVHVRASGFGVGGWPSLYGHESAVTGETARYLGASLVLIPSLFVLFAAGAAKSESLARRVDSLRRLGAPRRVVVMVLSAEATLPAAAGAAVGVALTSAVMNTSFVVPFTGYRVTAGDGVIPMRSALVVIVAVAVAMSIVAVLVGVIEGRAATRKQRVAVATMSSVVATVAPLGLAAGVIGGGEVGANLFGFSLLLLLLTLPVGIRLAAAALGTTMSRVRFPSLHVAGSRIAAVSHRPARLLVGLSALIIIASTVQVFFTRFDRPAEAPVGRYEAFDVSVLTAEAFDVPSLVSADGVVAVIVERPNGSMWIGCAQVCQATRLSVATAFPGSEAHPSTAVIADPTGQIPESPRSVTVIADRSDSSDALGAIMEAHPTAVVMTERFFRVMANPVIPWINVGLLLAALLCLSAVGLGYCAAARASALELGTLVRMGVGDGQLRRIALAEVLVPFVVCVAGSTAVAAAVAAAYAHLDRLGMPSLTFVITIALVSSVIAATLAVFSGTVLPRAAQNLVLDTDDA